MVVGCLFLACIGCGDSRVVENPTGQDNSLKTSEQNSAVVDDDLAEAPETKPTVEWLSDYEVAKQRAGVEKKPIMVLFTGGRWCDVCNILEKEVLETSEFADFASRTIPVKIDFEQPPYKSESQEDDPRIRLGEKFGMNVGQDNARGLHGYPSIFVVSSDEARAKYAKLRLVQDDRSLAENISILQLTLSAAVGQESPSTSDSLPSREKGSPMLEEASDVPVQVKLTYGTSKSPFAPSYSPPGQRFRLQPVKGNTAFGFDPKEGMIQLGWPLEKAATIKVLFSRKVEDGPYCQMFVDADGDAVVDSEPHEGNLKEGRGAFHGSFSVLLRVKHEGNPLSPLDYPVSFWFSVDDMNDAPEYFHFSRRGYLIGETTVAGTPATIVLSDSNNDAVYGEGDWWEIVATQTGRLTGGPRRVGDFSWMSDSAYKLTINDPSGMNVSICPYDAGKSKAEDDRDRDQYAADRAAKRAEKALEFRHDGEVGIADALQNGQFCFLKFETDWCGPCKTMTQLVFTAQDVVEAANNIVCVKVDGDTEKDLVEKFKIGAYPTLVLLNKSGEEIQRQVGYLGVEKVVKFFQKASAQEAGRSNDLGQADAASGAPIPIVFKAVDPDSEDGIGYAPYAKQIPLAMIKGDQYGARALQGELKLGWPADQVPPIAMVLAQSKDSTSYDQLFIDANADGEIDKEPLDAKKISAKGEFITTFQLTLQATYLGDKRRQVDYPVEFWFTSKKEDTAPSVLLMCRRGFFQAQVKIDNLPAYVILSDSNNDGIFQDEDWWELLQEPISDDPRKVEDFAWFGSKAFKIKLTDPAGLTAVIAPHKTEKTKEQDKQDRDVYAADRIVDRASSPVAFRHDGKSGIEEAARNGKRCFVKFETSWCGPCKMMSELVFTAKATAETLEGIECIKVDSDEDEELTNEFKVIAYPTGILLDESGKELRRFEGYKSVIEFNNFIDSDNG